MNLCDSCFRLETYGLQVLAALDSHTTKWIVENCFKGDLMRGRTVIFVVRFYSSMSVSPPLINAIVDS